MSVQSSFGIILHGYATRLFASQKTDFRPRKQTPICGKVILASAGILAHGSMHASDLPGFPVAYKVDEYSPYTVAGQPGL